MGQYVDWKATFRLRLDRFDDFKPYEPLDHPSRGSRQAGQLPKGYDLLMLLASMFVCRHGSSLPILLPRIELRFLCQALQQLLLPRAEGLWNSNMNQGHKVTRSSRSSLRHTFSLQT